MEVDRDALPKTQQIWWNIQFLNFIELDSQAQKLKNYPVRENS